MTTLLELKEKLIRFYGKNEIYVKPAIRFVLALFTFLMINNSIGYMKLVSKTPDCSHSCTCVFHASGQWTDRNCCVGRFGGSVCIIH